MAWMRMMGADSVDYHRKSIIERGDDHPGQALGYYGTRGETPLLWGGSGADRLGLAGAVADADYDALYGPGGARHPDSGSPAGGDPPAGHGAGHRRPQVGGRAGRDRPGRRHAPDHGRRARRHPRLSRSDHPARVGGRRGRAATKTATAGLVYAHARHATSRSGDPAPHDHVLLANLVRMLDQTGGWKAADTHRVARASPRRHDGRPGRRRPGWRSSWGTGSRPTQGRSGRLRHWRISGVPDEVIQVHSKRATEIQEEIDRRGRKLLPGPRGGGPGHPTSQATPKRDRVAAPLAGRARGGRLARPAARQGRSSTPPGSSHWPRSTPARSSLRSSTAEGRLAVEKVFARKEVIVEIAPHPLRPGPDSCWAGWSSGPSPTPRRSRW